MSALRKEQQEVEWTGCLSGLRNKERFTRAQLVVQNPTNCTKPGHGQFIGESGEEALAKGRLKYFDMDVVNPDNTRGNYRQAVIENIKRLKINGEEYIVIK